MLFTNNYKLYLTKAWLSNAVNKEGMVPIEFSLVPSSHCEGFAEDIACVSFSKTKYGPFTFLKQHNQVV